VGLAVGKSLSGIQSSLATGSVVTNPPSPAGRFERNQPSVLPSPSWWTPGRPVYATDTTNVARFGMSDDGVITILVAGHWWPFCDVSATCGEHAGGLGLVGLTGLRLDTSCANGSGSSSPLGSPG
jgi:hypothetical protein